MLKQDVKPQERRKGAGGAGECCPVPLCIKHSNFPQLWIGVLVLKEQNDGDCVSSAVRAWLSEIRGLMDMCCIGLQEAGFALQCQTI